MTDDLMIFDDEPEVRIAIEPTSYSPLAQLLPADFPLPALIHFVPNQAIKAELDAAIAYAAGLAVAEKGLDGLQSADLALETLNDAIRRTTQHFAEPADIANRLHKSITSARASWCDPAEVAKKMLGGKIYAEKYRLDNIAAAERRKQQEAQDAIARESARIAAEQAEKGKAPAAIVERLKEQAKTAVAPPVPAAPQAASAMKSSTTTTTWKARIKGTMADADPNPLMAEMSEAQFDVVAQLLRDVADGKSPRSAVEINWSYLNARAKADKSTMAIQGIEAFAEGGVRAKGRR